LEIDASNLRGLGAIEGNVDKLVANRMKKRGMSWTLKGAQRMARLISLREMGQIHYWITRKDRPEAGRVPEKEVIKRKITIKENFDLIFISSYLLFSSNTIFDTKNLPMKSSSEFSNPQLLSEDPMRIHFPSPAFAAALIVAVPVARLAEDCGVDAIAVHPRTRLQGFSGKARWEIIQQVKAAVRIPVIGNGDVKTVSDIDQIQAQTGCDGVMIGRAAIGNPWIFSRKERDDVTPWEKIDLMRRHLRRNLDFYGQHIGLVLFRKHAYRYVTGAPGAAGLRRALMVCDSVDGFLSLLDEYAQAGQKLVIDEASSSC